MENLRDQNEPVFTVFTPAHNAAETLGRVYESLLKQSFRNFEWLVVDDGSSDSTKELVTGWQKAAKTWFPVRYFYQGNAHKKVAHNRAVGLARGQFFLPLDADDECTEWALETLYQTWCSIPVHVNEKFAGVCCLCKYESGDVVGDMFPGNEFWDGAPQEIRHKYRVKGEKWGFNRTDILRGFLFPENIPGYVPEGLVWDAIGRRYKTRFINETLRIYHQESQAQKSQRSVNLVRFREPGRLAHKKEKLNNDLDWFTVDPIYFIKDALWVGRFTLHVPRGKRDFVKLKNPLARILVWTMFPLAVLVYCKDKLDARAVSEYKRKETKRWAG